MTLKAMYEQARDTPGDINEHVSYLKDMASPLRPIRLPETRPASEHRRPEPGLLHLYRSTGM